MKNIIEKIQNHQQAKLIFALIVIVFLYLIYLVYAWANTETTDNAYVDADISSVSSEVDGIISEVLVQENNIVEVGQIIAKINDNVYKANLDKADAALEFAKKDIDVIAQNIKIAQIEQSKTEELYQFAEENFQVSKDEYKRTEELSKDNYASKKNLDNARIAYKKNKSDLAQAKFTMQTSKENFIMLEIKHLASIAKYNTAVAERSLALRNFENTVLRAPVSGKIGNSSLRAGNYVRTGMVLFSIVPIDQLYIKANFKETQVSKFKPDMPVEVIIDSEPSVKIIGTIRNISPATGSKFSLLPPANATGNFTKIVQRVPVTINFTVPEKLKNRIVPGMSAYVKIRI